MIDGYQHEVRLIVGADTYKIQAIFADGLPLACLLGRRGFFDKFTVCFDPTDPPGIELTRFRKR